MIQTPKSVVGRVQNIAGTGKNDDHQHFLLFQQCIWKKVGILELCDKRFLKAYLKKVDLWQD